MLIVNNWFGRTGNNILQLIRAIHYAKINNHNNIKFNKHSLLNKDYVELKALSENLVCADEIKIAIF